MPVPLAPVLPNPEADTTEVTAHPLLSVRNQQLQDDRPALVNSKVQS